MICEAAAEQIAASICDLLAQLGERLGDNQKVGGSSPPQITKSRFAAFWQIALEAEAKTEKGTSGDDVPRSSLFNRVHTRGRTFLTAARFLCWPLGKAG